MKKLVLLLALVPLVAHAERYCDERQAITVSKPKTLQYADRKLVVLYVTFDYVSGDNKSFEAYEYADKKIVLPIGMTLTVTDKELIVHGASKDTTLKVCR